MLDTVVEESGKIFISTELGGGGFVSPRTISIAENGGYLMSPNAGLYEPLVELGEQVYKGQLIGRLHSLTEIDSPALEITSKIEGMLVTRAGRAPLKHWDTIAVIASDFDVSVYE